MNSYKTQLENHPAWCLLRVRAKHCLLDFILTKTLPRSNNHGVLKTWKTNICSEPSASSPWLELVPHLLSTDHCNITILFFLLLCKQLRDSDIEYYYPHQLTSLPLICRTTYAPLDLCPLPLWIALWVPWSLDIMLLLWIIRLSIEFIFLMYTFLLNICWVL